MMAVLVRCPCGRTARAPEEHRGKQTTCPKCGRKVVIEGDRVPDRDVFVSYSSLDKPTADAACAVLESRGIRCWIAPRDILPGAEWSDAIVSGIEQCRITVLVFSSHSNLSPQVRRELERAVHMGHPIIPFRIQDAPPCRAMQYYISSQHWLDAMTPPLEKHLRDLAEIVVRLASGTKDAEVLARQYLVRRGARLWSARWVAALGLAILLAGVVTLFALLRHGDRSQAIGAQTQAAEARQQALQQNPAVAATIPWSKAQEAEAEAASAFESRDYSTAHARWVSAATSYDEAVSVLPGLLSMEAAKKAYQEELSKYDRVQLEKEGGKAWQHVVAMAADAEKLGGEGRFQEAADKYQQAKRSILPLTRVGRELQLPVKQWEFDEIPLSDLIDLLRDMYGVQIEVNEKALLEIRVDPSATLVTSRLKDVPLAEALRLVLARINSELSYTVRNGRKIYISTKKDIGATAAGDLAEAIRLELRDAGDYFGRGIGYVEWRNFDKAILDFSEAIRLNKNCADYYVERGNAYEQKNDHDKAIADCTEALRLNPQCAEAYYVRAIAYAEKGDLDKAAADCTEAIRLKPQYAEAYRVRGVAFEDKGDYGKAIADYTEAIRFDPSFALAHYNRARLFAIKGDRDKAIADYAEAIRLDPKSARAHWRLSLAYQEKGDDDEAIAHCTQAIQIDPTLGSAYRTRGIAYHRKGDPDKAIADYNEAIRLDPKDVATYYNRGNSYAVEGDFDKAIADFNEAIRLDPKHVSTYCNRGRAYAEKGNFDKAIADYTEAIRLDPKVDAYAARAAAHAGKGDHDKAVADYRKAVEEFQQAIRSNAENAALHNAVAWLWATCPEQSMRDGSRAVEHARKACELTHWKEPGYLDTLAAACAESGDYANAVKWQGAAVQQTGTARKRERENLQKRLDLYQQGKPYRHP
jgi:tetratricopeptide (TPR) repeat protein